MLATEDVRTASILHALGALPFSGEEFEPQRVFFGRAGISTAREVSSMQNLAQHRRLLIAAAVLIAIAAAVTLIVVYSGGGGGGGGGGY